MRRRPRYGPFGLLSVRDLLAPPPAPSGRGRQVRWSFNRRPIGASGDLEGLLVRAGQVVCGRQIGRFSSTTSAGVAGSGGGRQAWGRSPTRMTQRYVGTSVLPLVVHKADYGDGAPSSSGVLVPAASSRGARRRRRTAGVAGAAEFLQGPGCNSVFLRGFLCYLFGPACPSGSFCMRTCTVLWSYLILYIRMFLKKKLGSFDFFFWPVSRSVFRL